MIRMTWSVFQHITMRKNMSDSATEITKSRGAVHTTLWLLFCLILLGFAPKYKGKEVFGPAVMHESEKIA